MKVTKEEFEKYISEYPRPLKEHLVTIRTPFLLEYHDFALGKPPMSVVASRDIEGTIACDNKGEEWCVEDKNPAFATTYNIFSEEEKKNWTRKINCDGCEDKKLMSAEEFEKEFGFTLAKVPYPIYDCSECKGGRKND